MRRVAAIPAYQAERTVGPVIEEALGGFDEVWVIDDGSSDQTREASLSSGARVFSHPHNLGKSAALRTALAAARDEGIDALVTLDADGQHPAGEAIRLDREADDRGALVLGVRDLAREGAPRANQRSNRISNFWLSLLAGRPLADTQCGLRRYPVLETLALGARGERFCFESEVVLRAALRGVPLVELPVRVRYPADRTTHFHVVRDPLRIIGCLLAALFDEKLHHRRA